MSVCRWIVSFVYKKVKSYYNRSAFAYIDFSRKTPADVKKWIQAQYEDLGIVWKEASIQKWEDDIDGEILLEMSVENIKEVGHSHAMACRLKRRMPKIQSAADISTLIQIILLVAALLLSFSISLHSGTFKHEDLLEGDLRFFRVWDTTRAWVTPKDDCKRDAACLWLLSQALQHHAGRAVFCFTAVLVAGMSIATSLLLSNYSEGEVSIRFYFVLMTSLVGCYVMEIVGMYYLYSANLAAVNLEYPFYNSGDDILHYGAYRESNGTEVFAYFSIASVDGWVFYWHMQHTFWAVPVTIFGVHLLVDIFF
jgi:hypothetical protein